MDRLIRKIQYDFENDRYIYTVRDEDNKLVEINFTQGNDPESFKDCQVNDPKLLRFVNTAMNNIDFNKSLTEQSKINNILLLYGMEM